MTVIIDAVLLMENRLMAKITIPRKIQFTIHSEKCRKKK